MKITVGGDRDWRRFFAGDLVVTLDGVEVKDAIEADDEAGYIVRIAKDAAGKPIAADFRGYELERVEGAVVFDGIRKFSPDDAKAAAASKRARKAARNCTILNRAEVRAGGLT